MRDDDLMVWSPFVRVALGFAIAAGFGLGGLLFAASALHLPLGAWWSATAQAHGHVQLFGWIGLPVCGIGWHFLPRLRGAPHPNPRRTALALGLLATGILTRVLVQPTLAAVEPTPTTLRSSLLFLLLCSGLLELGGASLVLVGIVGLPRQGPPLAGRSGFRAIWPLVLVGFVACWLALATNLVGLVQIAVSGATLVAAPFDRVTIDLALYGFLLPMTIAMSARLFPLYFQTAPPAPNVLRAGLIVGGLGLAARVAGDVGDSPMLAGLGRVLQAGGIGLFIVGLGIFAGRRPLPRRQGHPLADPIQLHALTAYAWLLFTAILLGWGGLAALVPQLPPPPDGERHALGVGFFTVLILGVGARLLPGFARRPLRHAGLCWLTLVLGNGAALLRVGPLLLPTLLPAAWASATLASAGIAGMLGLGLFAWNLAGVAPDRGKAPA